MSPHATLDCRLVFAAATTPDQRLEFTERIKNMAFTGFDVEPRNVAWTFGSAIFRVGLTRKDIIDAVTKTIPAEAIAELLIDGRRVQWD